MRVGIPAKAGIVCLRHRELSVLTAPGSSCRTAQRCGCCVSSTTIRVRNYGTRQAHNGSCYDSASRRSWSGGAPGSCPDSTHRRQVSEVIGDTLSGVISDRAWGAGCGVMSKARLVITAWYVEGQRRAEVAVRYGVHRWWVYRLKPVTPPRARRRSRHARSGRRPHRGRPCRERSSWCLGWASSACQDLCVRLGEALPVC